MRGIRIMALLAAVGMILALAAPVALAGPPAQEAARGQVCRNPNLEGPQAHYHDQLNGPPEWWIEDHIGVQRENGVTQPTTSQYKDSGNSYHFAPYLQPQYSSTAIEMGGAYRLFNWEFLQSGVGVRAGFTYTLTGVFHPIIMVSAGGGEVFLDSSMAGDWASNLQWRWRVLAGGGQVLAEDVWHNGNDLGTGTFNLPYDRPHSTSFTWVSDRTENVTFSLEFRNLWPIAVTKVWLHAVTCVEGGVGTAAPTTTTTTAPAVTPGTRVMQNRVGRLSGQ